MPDFYEPPDGYPADPVHRTRYRPGDRDGIAFCLVDAVAAAAGVSPLDIDDRLYHAVDTEALATLLQGDGFGPRGYVSFEFAGYDVVVSGSGHVSVY